MYYHNSPAVKNIKQLKAIKTTETAKAIKMIRQQTTAKYKDILSELEELREKEQAADQLLARFPDKAEEVENKMQHNYKIVNNKLDKFLNGSVVK